MKMNRPTAEVSTSSMADIAFLLLTFFLMTTVIETHKGIPMILPQLTKNDQSWKSRNLFTIQVNGENKFLVEGEPKANLDGIREDIKEFIFNKNGNSLMAESPVKAVISVKTDRATKYETFVKVLDEIMAVYYDIYAERVGMSPAEFRNLDLTIEKNKHIHDLAKSAAPMNISIADPTGVK